MAVVRISTTARNALANAFAALVDADAGAGSIKIYTGAQPATPETAASGTLLATVALGDPAFAAAATGTITGANPAAVTAVGSGTAGWFRLADNSGDAILDGDVTATGGGGTLQLSSTSITSGGSVDVTALSVTVPAS